MSRTDGANTIALKMARRGAYLTLCAAMDDTEPACASDLILWDSMSNQGKATFCATCPLRKQCRAYAELDPGNTWGVWGGRVYPRAPKGKIREDTE